MTQTDKDLLLKDLCARLPYGIKCSFGVGDAIYEVCGVNPTCCGASEIQATAVKSSINGDFSLSSCKPYLFPLSSMTEEQKKYINSRWGVNENFDFEIDPNWGKFVLELDDTIDFINWLLKNHFDIYGLIPMGLANDATGLNIY